MYCRYEIVLTVFTLYSLLFSQIQIQLNVFAPVAVCQTLMSAATFSYLSEAVLQCILTTCSSHTACFTDFRCFFSGNNTFYNPCRCRFISLTINFIFFLAYLVVQLFLQMSYDSNIFNIYIYYIYISKIHIYQAIISLD